MGFYSMHQKKTSRENRDVFVFSQIIEMGFPVDLFLVFDRSYVFGQFFPVKRLCHLRTH